MIDTAYILAGGRSRRMGRDKLFVECEGTSLLSRTVQTCHSVFAHVKLVAKQPGKLGQFDCDIVLDWPYADGPLAGVIAALRDCAEECCFVTAADLYDLNRQVIEELIDTYNDQQYFGVQEPTGGQPLCGLYNQSALHFLMRQGETGKYQMREAIDGLEHGWLPLNGAPWRNINVPSDLISIGHSNA